MKELFKPAEIKLILLCLLCLGLSSCGSGSSNEDDDESSLITPAYENISGKYEISGSNTFSSIELSESGNYIIIKKISSTLAKQASVEISKEHRSWLKLAHATMTRSSSTNNVIYGKYTLKADGSITLEGFGTLVITTSGNNVTNLTLTPISGSTITLNATKDEFISSDTQTTKLCRTWNILTETEKYYENGQLVETVDYNATTGELIDKIISSGKVSTDDSEMPVQVLFSKSGTYLVYYKKDTAGIAYWTWKNGSSSTINYKWDDSDYDQGEFNVSFYSNKAKITEDKTYTESGTTYRDCMETVLQSVD